MSLKKYSNVEEEFAALAEKPIDVMAILVKYLSYWKWFVLSVVICLAVTLAYLYFTLPQYKVATSIVFKDDQRGGGSSELNVFREMGVVTRRSNVDNEVEILKKSLIVEDVVRSLGLYVSYAQLEPVLPLKVNESIESLLPHYTTAILYGEEIPVKLSVHENNLQNLRLPIEFDLYADQKGQLTFSGRYNKMKFEKTIAATDSVITLPFGDFGILRNSATPKEDMHMRVEINHPINVAHYYLGNLEVELTSKSSSVADVSLVTYNVGLGVDFIRE